VAPGALAGVTLLEHVTLSASDFARSVGFYDAVLGALGLVRVAELVDEEDEDPQLEAVAWGPAGGPGVLWLVVGGERTIGLHVQFRASSREQVETFHTAGVRLGAESRSAPRRWPIYRRGEFSAMLVDPDRNVVEAVCDE
jgi:catechol 2,3-dioxygenase-like lactoylglutathione lyase family enzyme